MTIHIDDLREINTAVGDLLDHRDSVILSESEKIVILRDKIRGCEARIDIMENDIADQLDKVMPSWRIMLRDRKERQDAQICRST